MNDRKPTPDEIRACVGKTMSDIIGRDLQVLFCGINPSLYSAAVGHHFARPGNRFWKTLHAAGFTDRLLAPSEDERLLDYGYGITNVADRATATAAQVHQEKFLAGAQSLCAKVQHYRPKVLAILGISAYRIAFKRPKATMGLQEETIANTILWVLPNPSGLNAHYQLADLARVFLELKHFLDSRSF